MSRTKNVNNGFYLRKVCIGHLLVPHSWISRCSGAAHARLVRSTVARLDTRPNDAKANDVEPKAGNSLRISRRQRVWLIWRHRQCVGCTLVDSIHATQGHNATK